MVDIILITASYRGINIKIMKKILLVAALMLMAITGWARPALSGAVKCVQPDGSTVMLVLHGDEYYHFSTTTDGYTVLQSENGAWEYAVLEGNRLRSTGVQAHDVNQRNANEVSLLAGLSKNITDREMVNRSKVRRSANVEGPSRIFNQANFRGLIILINFTDVKFTRSDAQAFYTRMTSEKNYTGYTNEDGSSNYYGNFDGSVRDFFFDQSSGKFDPEFDVIGPVNSTYKATQCDANSRTIFKQALQSVDSQVNFADYDGDNDGVVDNVFFLVAGWGSHVQGNNSGLLWPHESRQLMTSRLDGKSFDRYACSTEMLGSENSYILEGIGTFCHEFSHVLGLPDFYDTNYATDGQSHDPGGWDIMAGGADYNYGRTPCCHSIFQRYALGWATPTVIREPGSFTLEALNTSNTGYIIKSPKAKEYFILDNRQKTTWDRFLPGHGMIVSRVDSSSSYIWVTNSVNDKESRNYFELVRAGNTTSGDLPSDPFPGTMGITRLSNTTAPALVTWDKTECRLKLDNIRENDGVITFNVLLKEDEMWPSLVETFEDMPVMTTSPTKGVEGVFAQWDFAKSYVKEPASEYCVGTKAVEMVYPSQFTSATPIYYNIEEVSCNVYNTSSSAAKMMLQYSLDDGATWTKATNVVGADAITIPGSVNSSCNWLVPVTNTQSVRFRVSQNSGHKTVPVYVDNFTVYYTGEEGGPNQGVTGDVTGDGTVDISDVNAVINIMLGKADKVDAADVNGDGNVDISDVNAVINIMLGKA